MIQIVLMRGAIEQVSLTLILFVPTIRAATKLQTPKGLGDRMLSHSFETPNEKFALEKLKGSIKFESGRYEVLVPWKEDRSVLPDNYDTALGCLRRTEKRIL